MAKPIPAWFLGHQGILGDPDAFAWNRQECRAAELDAFLGLTPGTTVYGGEPCFALQGRFVGPTDDAVLASSGALAGLHDRTGSIGLPTNLPYPYDFFWTSTCYFVAAEYVPQAPSTYPGNQRQIPYRLIVRKV